MQTIAKLCITFKGQKKANKTGEQKKVTESSYHFQIFKCTRHCRIQNSTSAGDSNWHFFSL